MSTLRDWRIARRDFLQTTAALALSLGAVPAHAEDEKNTHNMLVFGEQAVFFSHLPMFGRVNTNSTEFTSPHRYQVILEAAFTPEQLDHYLKDRQTYTGTRFYTAGPEEFVLSRLFIPEASPQLTSFTATIFRGHQEETPKHPVPRLQGVRVRIARVVHGRMFDPRANKPAVLEYLLLGRGKERFLAHAIFAPPDFDYVLPVNLSGPELEDRDIRQDVRVRIPDRKNVAADRLRRGQRVEAMLHIGTTPPKKVQLEAGPQVYFEEGELLVPPTFDPTDEEKRSEDR